jgi:preprotein translocase subunit Sec63
LIPYQIVLFITILVKATKYLKSEDMKEIVWLDWREVLEVGKREKDLSVIKSSYRRLLQKYHPDHWPNTLTQEERKEYIIRFDLTKRAYIAAEIDIMTNY